MVYVIYARVTPGNTREDHGAGLGLVDVFDPTGKLVRRLVDTGDVANAPWGVGLAPAGFGSLAGDVLIGDFGDGRINVFDPNTSTVVGTLNDGTGSPIVIPGLWALAFGNDKMSQPSTTLFYAAGPTATTGVYGRIDTAATKPAGS